MNELIKVNYDGEQPVVSGRELHAFLEVGTEYRHWFPRMCEYGFSDGVDYTPVNFDHPKNKQPTIDHALTVAMAKEICMIQRTDKGKQARQYFIALETAWNTPEAVMARALRLADGQIKKLQGTVSALTVENQIMKPKADYFDELVDRNLLTNFRETAKQFEIPPKAFVEFLVEKKYLYRDQRGKLMPYAQHIDNGLFSIKETVNEKTKWSGTQTLITPKGRETLRLLCVSKAG